MGADSAIEWTDHTFNPVWGCEKVSPACKFCYAEAWAKRTGHAVWGKDAPRRTFGDKHWAEPLRWNAAALKTGRPCRVFCASMADVFEEHPVWEKERPRLFDLIAATPALTWLLLTKRPENIGRLMPSYSLYCDKGDPWPNIWLGTTVEDQQRADERIPRLLDAPAAVHFLSCEPLLERVNLSNWLEVWGVSDPSGKTKDSSIDWVIIGGESGGKARPFALEWARSLIDQCQAAGVSPFFKQAGSHCIDAGKRLRLADSHGGELSELPPELHHREFPHAA